MIVSAVAADVVSEKLFLVENGTAAIFLKYVYKV